MGVEQEIIPHLERAGIAVDRSQPVQRLAADGSIRRLYRFRTAGQERLVAVLPGESTAGDLAEARAAWCIGSHLARRGLPVPRLVAHDPGSGLVVMEDLGDRSMEEEVKESATASGRRLLYRKAAELLARFHVEGACGFNPSWCWDTPCYDQELMISRESHYFYRALCQGMLGMGELSPALEEEFRTLAGCAAQAGTAELIHRDFQSRNLMVSGGKLMVIDFQGARLGPAGYDLASLIIDPYVGLDARERQEVVEVYQRARKDLGGFDEELFAQTFPYLLLQRNLQILGAFAFLSRVRGKVFFRGFLQPAADLLVRHLEVRPLTRFSTLKRVAEQVLLSLEGEKGC